MDGAADGGGFVRNVLLGGCSGKASDTVRIATKPMAEQFILSEMLAALIEKDTDLNVEITKGSPAERVTFTRLW